MPFTLLVFGMFTPSLKDMWKPILLLIGITLVIHIINIVLRQAGIAAEANYFFTYGIKGDPFTEMYWRILPYSFFFLIPAFLSFIPYMLIITLPFFISEKVKSKKDTKALG